MVLEDLGCYGQGKGSRGDKVQPNNQKSSKKKLTGMYHD